MGLDREERERSPVSLDDARSFPHGTSVAQQETNHESDDSRSGPMHTQSICADEDVLRRVRGEFLEMPGMRLTEAQAGRLWNLDAASCRAVLTALVDSRFLFTTGDGAFMRLEGARPARASIHKNRSIAAA